tara:strand:- start:3756 stop:6776 length:3021 start_codon:yes stop_codon:yes gene_type:complete
MKNSLFKVILALNISLIFSSSVIADEPSEEEVVVDEITVLGIKASLKDAIAIKRSNVGVVDAITAEDFGKFPDGNLAESLARVAGVGIDRSNVEGERVAVRGFGPEFNLVTLNGRQMPTVPGQYEGGRSFNFGDIASPGVSAVEVYKSTNSSLPSGGIGSTINMVTTKPLNIKGTKKSFSFNFVEDTTSAEDLGASWRRPIETTFLFSTNQGRMGFSFSGSYQDRDNREEGTRESNWLVPEDMSVIEGYSRVTSTQAGVTNNNTRADGKTFYQEPTAYQIKDNKRLRKNAQATFQFEITEDIVTTLDYTYSGVDFQSEGTMFGSWLGGWDTQQAIINSNGVYTDLVVANRSYDHQLIWGSTKNSNNSIGLNIDWQFNDDLSLSFDYHDSSSLKVGSELPNEMGFTSDKKGILTHTNGGTSGINTFSYDTAFNASDYYSTGIQLWDAKKENEIEQIQINGQLNLDIGLLKSVNFGISRIENVFADVRMGNANGATSPSAAQYQDQIFTQTGLGSFMDSFSSNLGTNYYYHINRSLALAAFKDANGAITAGDIDSNERIIEDLNSAFIQLNMETEIYNMPLNIVAGVRYESTDNESISLEAKPSTIRWDFINGLEYVTGEIVDAPRYGEGDEVLPSVAMSLGITENQVIRFSYSDSIARPSLQDLRSQLTYGNKNYLTPTASGGNPALEPLQSSNLDLSYENYYAEGSYFALNYFRKEVENFIGSRTVNTSVDGLTNPAQSAIGQFAQTCVQEWADAGRPDTVSYGDPGSWTYCVSQQAIWAQSWMNDFQHMAWVALGMQANGGTLPETWNNGWAFDYGGGSPNCNDGGWWRCNPGYIDGQAGDPLAAFEVTRPFNKEEGTVSGIEVALQHLFEGTPYGMQFNYTEISGGDVDVDRSLIGEQFILDGLGDSGNLSVFYEDEKHTARIALNYRGETVAGFANYDQPLYVEERTQVDLSYQYRVDQDTTLFFDAMNINDESTRLHARHSEMLFLSQDHGPVYKFGFRINF